MFRIRAYHVFLLLAFMPAAANSGAAQSLGNAGTIEGIIVDPSGAAAAGVSVEIRNLISGYARIAKTNTSGAFTFTNVPPNQYHLTATAPGFAISEQDITVRTSVPIKVNIALTLAGSRTSVTVEAQGGLLENVPYPHDDVDRSAYLKLPISSPGIGLSDAILITPLAWSRTRTVSFILLAIMRKIPTPSTANRSAINRANCSRHRYR